MSTRRVRSLPRGAGVAALTTWISILSNMARYFAVVPLPACAIDRIKTGQCGRDKGQIWVAEFPFPETFV